MTNTIAQDLIDFIAKSPTPFHATQNLLNMFIDAGFTQLFDNSDWDIKPKTKYVISRNDSSIIAFNTGNDVTNGIKVLGAHLLRAE